MPFILLSILTYSRVFLHWKWIPFVRHLYNCTRSTSCWPKYCIINSLKWSLVDGLVRTSRFKNFLFLTEIKYNFLDIYPISLKSNVSKYLRSPTYSVMTMIHAALNWNATYNFFLLLMKKIIVLNIICNIQFQYALIEQLII